MNQSNKVNESESISIDNNDKLLVLIIDDDKWIQQLLTRYFKTWGFVPLNAYDPYTAISMALNYEPIFILLDIFLPEVSGNIILKILKNIEQTRQIPVIIMSGNLNPDMIADTYKNGASGFLSKPFNVNTLLDKIKEALGPELFSRLINENNISLKSTTE